METIQLNEEIKIKNDGLEVIVLIDYKNKQLEIFKHYEDKNFNSKELIRYMPILQQAYQIGQVKLHPEKANPIVLIKNFKSTVFTPKKIRGKLFDEYEKPTYGRGKVKAGAKTKPEKIHRIYGVRVCTKCGEEYVPTWPGQKQCKKYKP